MNHVKQIKLQKIWLKFGYSNKKTRKSVDLKPYDPKVPEKFQIFKSKNAKQEP